MALADRVLAGDRRALARLISHLENDTPAGREALAALWPHTGRAHVVGVTGPSGVGKSTLVNEVVKVLRPSPLTPAPLPSPTPKERERGEGWPKAGVRGEVAILAVDPTSPFSGGAILGDRIRMRDLSGDPGVFIRSMATRGRLGGLARATGEAVRALDAAGFGLVLVETVGAGQSEVEIARTAHTVVVVEAPGLGDDIQAGKAGLLEIADILVVNKADQPGAEASIRALREMLALGRSGRDPAWEVPICRAVAVEGQGVGEIVQAIERHRAHLLAGGGLAARERERVVDEMLLLLREALLDRLLGSLENGQFEAAVARVLERRTDPRREVERLTQEAHS